MQMPICDNCAHPGTHHHWKVTRLRGRCQHHECDCAGYVPATGRSAPVNSTIGRALRKKH